MVPFSNQTENKNTNHVDRLGLLCSTGHWIMQRNRVCRCFIFPLLEFKDMDLEGRDDAIAVERTSAGV
jgi:hypothetical protein